MIKYDDRLRACEPATCCVICERDASKTCGHVCPKCDKDRCNGGPPPCGSCTSCMEMQLNNRSN